MDKDLVIIGRAGGVRELKRAAWGRVLECWRQSGLGATEYSLQHGIKPKSPMGQAITYALNQWEALCVYTTDGDLSIDNNTSENTLRRVALGRNNWTFLGSDAGGKTAAIHFSLIASCQRHEVNPFEYLKDVLDRIASTPISKLCDLLPSRWKPQTDLPPAN